MKKIGVFIPGRLSSERLPNKLILPLGDSCLWEMACKKINNLPSKYNVYVLCNDPELLAIAERYENIKIIRRDPETCNAEGPLNYIFKDLKNLPDTHLMFLNPCLSFLSEKTIVDALEYFEESNYDYGTSVKIFQNWLFKKIDSSKPAQPLTPIDYERLTTKEIKPMYQAAHCFHIFNKEQFFKDGMMLKEDMTLMYIPHEETIDVDTYEDYEYVKWKHSKKYVIDIDSTICEGGTFCGGYKDARPIPEAIRKVNRLYDAGNIIWFQTARGYVSGEDYRELTEKQLKQWRVKYHKLLFDKPDADYYIDDKALNVRDWK